jgi:hypothetical protein
MRSGGVAPDEQGTRFAAVIAERNRSPSVRASCPLSQSLGGLLRLSGRIAVVGPGKNRHRLKPIAMTPSVMKAAPTSFGRPFFSPRQTTPKNADRTMLTSRTAAT